jgi:hypothetical protein
VNAAVRAGLTVSVGRVPEGLRGKVADPVPSGRTRMIDRARRAGMVGQAVVDPAEGGQAGKDSDPGRVGRQSLIPSKNN